MATPQSDIEHRFYQDYSPDRKAEAISLIEAANGNTSEVSRATGIPRQSLDYWWQNKHRFAEVQPQKRLELVEKLDYCADLLVSAIPGKIAAPLVQVATAAAIMIDKSQLLKGLPTSIGLDIERTELVVIMQSSLSAGLELDAIDAVAVGEHNQPDELPAIERGKPEE